jgi:hypothetical protein
MKPRTLRARLDGLEQRASLSRPRPDGDRITSVLEDIAAGTWSPTPEERARIQTENAAADPAANERIVRDLQRLAGENKERPR